MLVSRISLTLSRHFSLSFIASGRSSGQHPVSSHSCWMYVRAGRPAFSRPCVGVHKSKSLMSSPLQHDMMMMMIYNIDYIYIYIYILGLLKKSWSAPISPKILKVILTFKVGGRQLNIVTMILKFLRSLPTRYSDFNRLFLCFTVSCLLKGRISQEEKARNVNKTLKKYLFFSLFHFLPSLLFISFLSQ